MSTEKTQPAGRKKGTACLRCRNQKIRCDDCQPSCKNCAKAGQACVRQGQIPDAETIGYIQQLEARVWTLEDSIRRSTSHENAVPSINDDSIITSSDLDQGIDPNLPTNSGPGPDPNPTASVDLANTHNWSMHGLPVDEGHRDLRTVGHQQSTPQGETATPRSTAGSTTQIRPSEPLAHEVGLLSLANSNEPKYLGPSSGVPFARLILSAIPQSQGLPANLTTPGGGTSTLQHARPEPFAQDWVFDVDLKHFVDAYFDAYQPLYPFLDEEAILTRLNDVFARQTTAPCLADFNNGLSPVHCVQILLVIALGARTLEPRLSADFSSERYLATAMFGIDKILLHDSIDGLQIMLLLTLCSLCFVDGPNAWFLTSNLIAACLDLGLQRKWVDGPMNMRPNGLDSSLALKNVRRGIFWSTYSLERTLSVVLGRPLTLRDEAIDVEFPGAEELELGNESTAGSKADRPAKRRRTEQSPYTAASYSFQLDQFAAEMKLMLYRVNNKPGRFPWLMATADWQQDAQQRCKTLLEDMTRDLRWRTRRSAADSTVQSLEIKYHQCVMLLHRPSPAIPQPDLNSWKLCYESAAKTILIAADLNRFSKLNNSWLTAHNIFISGITFLYCLWTTPEIKNKTSLTSLQDHVSACSNLLRFLGKTWSVAAEAFTKFERLAQFTIAAWTSGGNGPSSDEVAASHSLLNMQRPPDWPLSPSAQGSAQGPLGNMEFYNGEGNEETFDSQFFYSELEDISGWFDLNWMMNAERGETAEHDNL